MSQKQPYGLGTAEVRPGSVSWGKWSPVPDSPESEVPVAILAGVEQGPTLWIQGCLHGDEFDAALVIQRLVSTVDPAELRGTVVAVPVANMAALEAANRLTPNDGKDTNRQFPGDDKGTFSERLAFALWKEITARADYLIDVHSSTYVYLGIAHVIYFMEDSGASRLSGELARRAGEPVVWQSTGSWLSNALYCRATQEGIPSVLVDVGDVDHRAGGLDQQVNGVMNMLRHTGMLQGEGRDPRDYWVVREPAWILSDRAGLLLEPAATGTRVRGGEPLFRVVGFQGELLQEVACPHEDGLVITVRRARVARPQLDVISVGQVVEGPGGPEGPDRIAKRD